MYNMAEHWRDLSYAEYMPDSLILSLPSLTVQSLTVSLRSPVEDIPIRNYSGIKIILTECTSGSVLIDLLQEFTVYFNSFILSCYNLLKLQKKSLFDRSSFIIG